MMRKINQEVADIMSTTDLLRNVSLFAQVNDDELTALASELLPQSFHKNQIVFQQGSITNSLYIVKSGRIRVTAFHANHETAYVGEYGPEQYFGEFSLLDGLPRSGEAVAVANSDLLVLNRPNFFRYLEHYPTVAIKLLVLISRRMRFAESAIDHPHVVDSQHKITNVLLEVAERYGTPDGALIRLAVRLTSDDLAGLSGLPRDVAYSVIEQLRAAGSVQIDRAHIVTVDTARLKEAPASVSRT
jgi:CRP/FNR family transcriptional regulator, cyclic AMP receptor protein